MNRYRFSPFVFLLALLPFFFACSNDDNNSVPEENVNEQQEMISITGRISLEGTSLSDEEYVINTFFDDTKATDGNFDMVSYSNGLPQLVYVTDASDNIIMMASDCFTKDESVLIDEESTAIALITMYPLFANSFMALL